MDHFAYRNGQLFCEQLDMTELAEQVGTPAYVYSKATLLDHYGKLAEAFAPLSPTICFSVKSLANLHVLRLLADAGSGFDVVSGGELARVLAAGGDPAKVAFAGVGKTDRELREALEAGVGVFNVESEAELANLSTLAGEMGVRARAALRVNPDVYDRKTHAYTATGKKESKFGVDIDRAESVFESFGADENVTLDGIHLHIGSPIYSARPYVDATTRALELIDRLTDRGLTVGLLNLGGGYAADYEEGKSPAAAEYAEQIVPLLSGRSLEFMLEPGRQIAGNAGVLLTRVQYLKPGHGRQFAIVDAAMTDLLRPALYDAEHVIYPAQLETGAETPPRRLDYAPPGAQKVDVVGGVCESSDFLAKGRDLPPLRRGDLLAVFTAGAYGFVMSSNYNSRPRACEVLVDGACHRIIRRRETYDDLLALERE
jgi:diaminopimelate decarboxylase